MQGSNRGSQILGAIVGLLLVFIGVWGFNIAIGFWRTTAWIIFILILVGWWYSGWGATIDIGRGAVLTYLGERQAMLFREGKPWTPMPFGRKEVDLREAVVELPPVRGVTYDNIEVEAEVTPTRQIFDPFAYFDVNPTGIVKWLAETRAEIFREEVKLKPYEKVIKMSKDLEKTIHASLEGNPRWGIKITSVAVSNIHATNLEVQKDLELKEREVLQRVAQTEEAKHTVSLIKLYMLPIAEGGGGLSLEDARDQANLATGKANPRNLTSFSLSPEVRAAAREILGRP